MNPSFLHQLVRKKYFCRGNVISFVTETIVLHKVICTRSSLTLVFSGMYFYKLGGDSVQAYSFFLKNLIFKMQLLITSSP